MTALLTGGPDAVHVQLDPCGRVPKAGALLSLAGVPYGAEMAEWNVRRRLDDVVALVWRNPNARVPIEDGAVYEVRKEEEPWATWTK